MTTLVHDLELPVLTPLSVDRAEALAELREAARSWLARTPFGYAVLRHEDILNLLRERSLHQGIGVMQMQGREDTEEARARRERSILLTEGATHDRLRRLVTPAFTPRAADRLRPFMRDLINESMDRVSAAGRCELTADVCESYPTRVICELLGAPQSDWPKLSRWADDIFLIFAGNRDRDQPVIDRANAELDEYARALIAERRGHPGEDLLTTLIAAEESGDRLSTAELVSLVNAVLMAGTHTTRNQLACSVAVFAAHPEQWDLLAERPELAPAAVDETMRYLGTVRGTVRITTKAIEYRGVRFPAGTLLQLSFLAANFDPRAFPRPERFDITAARTESHLTFGHGVHFCVGANLARAELQEALAILARRMRGLAIDGAVEWKAWSTGIWGPVRLPVRFEPGR